MFEGIKGRVQGREALLAYGRASLERGFFLHLVTNIDIRVNATDANRATARSHLLYVERAPDGAAKIAAGAQLDQLCREQGQWKIAHRRLDGHPVVDLPGAKA